MSRHPHRQYLKPFVAAVLALAFLPWVAPAPSPATAQAATATINVDPVTDTVWLNEFAPGASISMTADGTSVPGSPFTADPSGNVSVSFDVAMLDLAPGGLIEADDGSILKTHVITDVAVGSADPVTNVVKGTATPGTDVWVDVQGVNAGRNAVAAVDGSWATDFDDVGDYGETYDLAPGDWGHAQQCDADGDCTTLDWNVPNPRIAVDPNSELLWLNDFLGGSTVDVTVNGVDLPGSPFQTDQFGQLSTGFDPNLVDLVADDVVAAFDGVTAKDHVVTALTIDVVSPDTNVISGTADPGTEVWVDVWGYGGAARTVTADGVGHWETDFDDLGVDGDSFDLVAGAAGYANQCDLDDDCTQVSWSVPDPAFYVEPTINFVWGTEFTPDSSVVVTVNGVVAPGSPFPTDQNGTMATPDYDPATLDLAAGDDVVLTDGSTIKEHTVTTLQLTSVDPDTNVVSGTAQPGTAVWVDAHDANAGRTVYADGGGNWTTDFDHAGDHGESYDIGLGDSGAAQQCDADNDCTRLDWHVPDPRLYVDPTAETLWGNDFVPGSSVVVTVDTLAVPGSPFIADRWGNFEAVFGAQQLDLAAGAVVNVSDGNHSKGHTITALTVTSVDDDTNVVAGYAAIGSDVWVDVHGQADVGRTVTADPATGYWTTDFDDPGDQGGAYDFTEGEGGYANQCDADGDCTHINWNVADPRIIASVSHDEIWAENWPDDPLGQLLFFELDDPATPGIDVSGDMPLLITPWGTEAGDRSFGTYDVYAGMTLTVRNRPFGEPIGTGQERYLEVSHIVVTDVDADADTISGNADATEGGYLCVWSQDAQLCSDETGFSWDTGPAGTGDFIADFGSVGSDVAPGHWNEASQYDDDGDRTHFWWNLPPWVVVNLAPEDVAGEPLWPDEVRAESWIGPVVTLTIDGSFVADIVVSGNEHDQETIELPGIDIEPGDVVTLSDGNDTKSITVEPLGIDQVNFSTDFPPNTIDGSADPYRNVRVEVNASVGGRWAERWVNADAVGDFTADFGNPGTGWREQWTAELGGPQGLGRNVRLEIYDDDNDRVETTHCEGVPRIEVSRFDNRVTVYDYPQGTTVTIEIDDPNTTESPDYTATGIAMPNPDNPCETIIVFDIVDYQIPEQVTVVASDGTPAGTITHQTIAFTIDLVDPDTDQVIGTALYGTEVLVEADGNWRYVTADQFDSWIADFSVGGTEPGEEQTVDIGPGSSGRAIVVDEHGNATELTWWIPRSTFTVDPFTESLWANEFEPNSFVTVTVNGTAAPGSPFGTDGSGSTNLGFDPNELDLAAGDFVEVFDGVTAKDHTITSLTVDAVDPGTNVVEGTAEPGTEVRVDVHGGPGESGRTVIADQFHYWSTDFDDPGDGGGTYDFGPGDNGSAHDCDADNDCTQVIWGVPNARFQVDPTSEGLWVNEFEANSQVTVTIDRDDGEGPVEVPGSPFPTDGNGNFGTGFDPNELDLTEGDVVEVSDGSSTKDHTITRLTVELVDADTNVVAGMADPYTEVWVDVHNVPDAGRTVTADSTGVWDTDFDMPGDGGGTFDVGTGQGGYAAQCDDDGDCTWINWQVANPTFSVETPSQVWASNGDWTVGATATITVDDDSDIGDGVLFEGTATIEGWGFQLDTSPFVIEPGHVVTVTDGDATKALEVVDLQVTYVDQDQDVVFGTAPVDDWVEVDVGDEFGGAHRSVQADGDGNWSADFASPGPGSPDIIDIRPGVGGSAQVFDDDADSTHRGIEIRTPRFGVSAADDAEHGDGWPPNAEITITIDDDDDPGNGVLHVVTAWTGGDGHFEIEFGDEFDLEIGQFVAVTDGFDTKTHQVTGIAVIEVDGDADTVSGTAEPGATVEVRVNASSITPIWEQVAFQFGPGRFDRNPDSLTEHLELRQAVAHAIDRDALVAAIPGAGYAIDSYLDAVLPPLSTHAWAQYPYDPVLAAGLVDQMCTDLARDCATDPPVVVFTTTEENPDRVLLADLLQPMLAAAGIEMVIDLEPASEFLESTVPDGTFDLGEWAWASETTSFDGLREAIAPMDPEQRWSDNFYRWGTPDSAVLNAGTERFAELFGLMHGTDDPVELVAYSAEAEQILADQVVFIPLYVRAEGFESEQSPSLTVIADESGNWTADFSGYLDLTPGHEGSAAELDEDGDFTYIGWHVEPPQVVTLGLTPNEPVPVGTTIAAHATFAGDTTDARVDWGDGDVATVPVGGDLTIVHVFDESDVFLVSVTAIGSDGSESEPLEEYAVVYDADGKQMSGKAELELGDDQNAEFGFKIKREKDGGLKGDFEAELEFGEGGDGDDGANLAFEATDFDLFLVFSDWAYASGTGVLDDGTAVEWFIHAVDGELSTPDGPDLIRFQITVAGDPGAVIFDSEPDLNRFDRPTIVLDDGKIKIKRS